ncbi:hypothetical protein HDU67_007195 [Dinochytrium kinnereticum]|nr:hypothetical protein HDU67_007195 [Dinochytrium kinnereticum]
MTVYMHSANQANDTALALFQPCKIMMTLSSVEGDAEVGTIIEALSSAISDTFWHQSNKDLQLQAKLEELEAKMRNALGMPQKVFNRLSGGAPFVECGATHDKMENTVKEDHFYPNLSNAAHFVEAGDLNGIAGFLVTKVNCERASVEVRKYHESKGDGPFAELEMIMRTSLGLPHKPSKPVSAMIDTKVDYTFDQLSDSPIVNVKTDKDAFRLAQANTAAIAFLQSCKAPLSTAKDEMEDTTNTETLRIAGAKAVGRCKTSLLTSKNEMKESVDIEAQRYALRLAKANNVARAFLESCWAKSSAVAGVEMTNSNFNAERQIEKDAIRLTDAISPVRSFPKASTALRGKVSSRNTTAVIPSERCAVDVRLTATDRLSMKIINRTAKARLVSFN